MMWTAISTGWYKYETRKCSKCKEFKRLNDFTTKEADKPAKKRVCEYCWEKAQITKMFGAANQMDNW